MERQRNISEMKEQNQIPDKEVKRNRDKQPTRCRVQNAGYKDAQGS